MCCKRKNIIEDKVKVYSTDSLLSFLSCAMNVEFVYVILLSINGFMENLDN